MQLNKIQREAVREKVDGLITSFQKLGFEVDGTDKQTPFENISAWYNHIFEIKKAIDSVLETVSPPDAAPKALKLPTGILELEGYHHMPFYRMQIAEALKARRVQEHKPAA